MFAERDRGVTIIELLFVVLIISFIAYFSWQAFDGWRSRNALRGVAKDIKFQVDKYRQRAIDKGYNYGMIFSDDGIYVFEDSGGTGANRFTGINNLAIDEGEYSDRPGVGPQRNLRKVSSSASDYPFFIGDNARGRLMITTASTVNFTQSRTGTAYTVSGTDITSAAIVPYSESATAPFDAGSLALFFSADGNAYLKDPTIPVDLTGRRVYMLGVGSDPMYIIRVAFDDPFTDNPDVPDYFEIAVNRYGASTMVRWHTMDSGATWNAQIQ